MQQIWSNWKGPVLYETGNKTVNFPTRHVSAEVRISSNVAFLKVKQHFQNPNPHALECSYRFKKLPTAVLTGIKADLFGKKIKFELKEKERAKEEYSDAIASGHTSFLATDKDHGGVTLSIGQLPSNALVIITLKLIYPLLYIQDHWLFIISKAFFPTEIFGKSHRNRSLESISNLRILIEEESDLVNVGSSTHLVQTKVSGKSAEVMLLPQKNKGLDLCIEYSVSRPLNSVLVLERDLEHKEYIGMVIYKPSFSPNHQGNVTGEYIFMIDCSFSMGGEKMDMVKEAMVFLLKSLPVDSKFNVISFASESKRVFQSSERYSDANVRKTIKKIAAFEASGGTDVLPGLKMALSATPDVRYPRNLIFLTDGLVGNEEKSLSLIRKHRKSTRFHAIGLGDDTDIDWLQAVGLETQGGFEIVPEAKDLSERLVKVLDRILTPSVTGITINWPGKDTIQAPKQDSLGNLYENDVLYAYAHFGDSKPRGKVRISVFDTIAQVPISTELSIPEPRDGNIICKLWAKDRISDLAEGPGNKETIKNTSLKYRIPSKETAFIGVSDITTTQSEDALVYIPPVVAGPISRLKTPKNKPNFLSRGRKKPTGRSISPGATPSPHARSRSRSLLAKKCAKIYMWEGPSHAGRTKQTARKGPTGPVPRKHLKSWSRSSESESSSESLEEVSQVSDESSSQSSQQIGHPVGKGGIGLVGACRRRKGGVGQGHSIGRVKGVVPPWRYRPPPPPDSDESDSESLEEASQVSDESSSQSSHQVARPVGKGGLGLVGARRRGKGGVGQGHSIGRGKGGLGPVHKFARPVSSGVKKPWRYRPPQPPVSDDSDSDSLEEASPESAGLAPGSLLWFIQEQHIDGSWSFDAVETELLTTVVPNKVMKSCGTMGKDVWATLQVLFILQTRFSAEINKTKLVIRKAENWLKTQAISYQKFLPELRKVAI